MYLPTSSSWSFQSLSTLEKSSPNWSPGVLSAATRIPQDLDPSWYHWRASRQNSSEQKTIGQEKEQSRSENNEAQVNQFKHLYRSDTAEQWLSTMSILFSLNCRFPWLSRSTTCFKGWIHKWKQLKRGRSGSPGLIRPSKMPNPKHIAKWSGAIEVYQRGGWSSHHRKSLVNWYFWEKNNNLFMVHICDCGNKCASVWQKSPSCPSLTGTCSYTPESKKWLCTKYHIPKGNELCLVTFSTVSSCGETFLGRIQPWPSTDRNTGRHLTCLRLSTIRLIIWQVVVVFPPRKECGTCKEEY